MSHGRIRVFLLWLTDLAIVYLCWIVAVWGYWAVGLGHYEHGFEFYLNLWPVGLTFTALNAVFRLYHGNALYPAAPVSPVEELRRLVASAMFTHLGVIALLALSRQTTEDYSRAVIMISGMLTAAWTQPVRNLARMVMHRLGVGQIPVVLTGGGAVMAELDRRIGQALGVPCRGADAPEGCAIRGLYRIMENPEAYRAMLMDRQSRQVW